MALRTSSIAILLVLAQQMTAQVSPPPDLNTYVSEVQRAFKVPGIALTIVKDAQVVLAKGYGVRTVGKNVPVDAQTLFGIASNTKAFTATALAILVEEGKLEWDAPVVRYMPSFALNDPYVTHEITVRDLLVHRSGLGLGAGDLLFWPASTYGRKEIVHRLRFIPLTTSFRSAYAYDNVLYSVAGELVEAVTGMSWESFVTLRILTPLGMTHSTVSHGSGGGSANIATPHAEIDNVVRPVQPDTSANTNPAGGINTCAEDIAKWLLVQLDSGRVAGSMPLFSPQSSRQLWSIVTPIPIGTTPPDLAPLRMNFNGYGLGFGIRDYRGRKIVSHTGGLPGYVSKIAFIPDLHLGVAVFTNQESGEAFDAITYHVLDHYLGAPDERWIERFRRLKMQEDSVTAATERQAVASRDTNSHPSLPLAKFAGTYRDPWYGDIVIALENRKLVMRFSHTPGMIGDLVHWQYDTFISKWRDPEVRADAYVTFALDPSGAVEGAKMRAVSPATDFSYDFQDLVLKPVR